jgi:hypothetical protein
VPPDFWSHRSQVDDSQQSSHRAKKDKAHGKQNEPRGLILSSRFEGRPRLHDHGYECPYPNHNQCQYRRPNHL